MHKIIINSLNSQEGLDKKESVSPSGNDYQGRTYVETESNTIFIKETDESETIEDLSRKQFGSETQREELPSTNFLINGIQLKPPSKKSEKQKDFSFLAAIEKIMKNSLSKNPDKELAELFYSIVNPGQIPDGHCSKCAFNTHLHFIGRNLEEAEDINHEKFVKFSKWFYSNISPEVVECEKTICGEKDETFSEFKCRVEKGVKEVTIGGESVLISFSGAHWFNAYNDGEKVWFIDSQSGKGFNIYCEDVNFEAEKELVNIVKVSNEKISQYDELWNL